MNYLNNVSLKFRLLINNIPVEDIWSYVPSQCSFHGKSNLKINQTTQYKLIIVKRGEIDEEKKNVQVDVNITLFENDTYEIDYPREYHSIIQAKIYPNINLNDGYYIDFKILNVSIGGCPLFIKPIKVFDIDDVKNYEFVER